MNWLCERNFMAFPIFECPVRFILVEHIDHFDWVLTLWLDDYDSASGLSSPLWQSVTTGGLMGATFTFVSWDQQGIQLCISRELLKNSLAARENMLSFISKELVFAMNYSEDDAIPILTVLAFIMTHGGCSIVSVSLDHVPICSTWRRQTILD